MRGWRACLIAALLAALAACSQDQIPTPQRALNRPTDIAVACVQGPGGTGGQPGMRHAVPAERCSAQVTNLTDYRTLGFIPNSSNGQVAVAGLNEGNGLALLIDLDAHRPGFDFLPVGRLPTTALTTSDGCRVVVSNEGSCDFASIDVAAVANGADAKTESPDMLFRVQPHTAAGPIRAKPHTFELLPVPGFSPAADTAVCTPDTPYLAYVAYPGCDLVAQINLATGEYVRGLFVRPDGTVVDAGPTPSCPVECADGLGQAAAPGPAPQTLPDALSLFLTRVPRSMSDPSYLPVPGPLLIGGASSRFVTSVALADPRSGAFGSAHKVELTSCPPAAGAPPLLNAQPRCDPRGVTRLRSVKVKDFGAFGSFVYAAALDLSARVIQIDDVGNLRECETQSDPQVVAARWKPTQMAQPFSGVPQPFKYCMPVDESMPEPRPTPPLRRPTALGPGIRVSGGAIDIAFAHPTSETADSVHLYGITGYVLGSNGSVTVIDIDPLLSFVEAAINYPHKVHNRNRSSTSTVSSITTDPTAGPPRIDHGSIRQAVPTGVNLDQAGMPIPALISVTQGGAGNTAPDFALHFPDPATAHFENWVFSYEGQLPDTRRGTGKLGTDADTRSTATLLDPGARFCAHGVLPGDFVVFAGCQDDTQCPAGESCFGAIGTRAGICLASTGTSGGGPVVQQAACLDLVNSRHEFRVERVYNGTLIVGEKPLFMPRPISLRSGSSIVDCVAHPEQCTPGCLTDADCQSIDVLRGTSGPVGPIFAKTSWVCDPQPWPGTTVRHCVATCRKPDPIPTGGWKPHDEDCQPDEKLGTNPETAGLYNQFQGFVCGHDPIGDFESPRRCVAARLPRDPNYDYDPRVGDPVTRDCFVAPVAYEVHAGLAFIAVGDRTPYVHSQTVAADSSCVIDPSFGPKRIGRVGYNAAMCPASLTVPPCPGNPALTCDYDDGDVNGIWDGTKLIPDPNPCLRVKKQPGAPSDPTKQYLLVWEMENPFFEIAVGPIAPMFDDHSPPNGPGFGSLYSFAFSIQGGFVPLGTGTNAFLPSMIRALPGPPNPSSYDIAGPPGLRNGQWLYVIDEGDQISQTLRAVLFGQMVRIDPGLLAIDPNTAVQ